MQLRRMFTAFVLMFGLSVFFLGRWASPTAEVEAPYDGDMRILDQPQDLALPPSSLVPTPKGRQVVAPVRISHYDIPLTALLAYQRAAGILAAVEPSCHLSWTLLAAIGRVESDHGRYGGATLGTDGVSHPQVVGVPLDGTGPVARIRDTDGGELDSDPTWDRAVGPMQFLPATWDMVGVDGDGDGVRSVDDLDDASLAAGVYLCAGPEGDLRQTPAMESALHRYNDSDAYVALVMAYEKKYRTGEFDVLAADGDVAAASGALAARPLSGTPLRARDLGQRLEHAIRSDVQEAMRAAEKTGGTTPGISARTTGTPSSPARADRTDPGTSTGADAGSATDGTPGGSSTGTGSPSEDPSTSTPDVTPTGTDSSGGTTSPSTPDPSSPDTSSPDTSSPGQTPSDPATSGAGSSGGDSTASPSEPAASCTVDPTADPTATESPSPTPSDPSADPTQCEAQATDPSQQEAACEPSCAPTAAATP